MTYMASLLVQFLCSIRRPFLRPDQRPSCGQRAEPVVKAGLTSPLVLVLTTASTMPTSLWSGRDRHNLEIASAVENAPGDAGQLVGERNDELDAVQAFRGCLDPMLEAMPLPAGGSQEHGMGPLHEEHPQVTIAAF